MSARQSTVRGIMMKVFRRFSIARHAWIAVLLLIGVAPAWPEAWSMQETAPPPVKPKPAATIDDRWYSVELAGARTGHMHTKVTQTSGAITTLSRMQMKVARGALSVQIRTESEVVETPEGRPISMRSKQSIGQQPVEQVYTFRDDGTIDIETRQGGQRTTRNVPAPTQDWMTPAKAERYAKERMKAGDKEIRVTMMDPSMGPVAIESTRTGFEPATLTIDDKPVEVIKTKVVMQMGQPITSTEYLDSEGELVRGVTSMSGMAGLEIIMTRTTRAKATDSVEDAKIPEIMVSTFVKPDKAIEASRSVIEGTYTLRVKAGELPNLPTTGSQQVERLDAQRATVRVRARDFVPAPAEDVQNAALLGASAYLETGDERLKSFVSKALRGKENASARERALALRAAVHEHIDEKNLGVGLATASEVVRTREGDCTEHGVLLAAALRVTGIRSRVAVGLIYADQFAGGKDIFGYHMWSQALLPSDDGSHAWVDLDATLGDGVTYDATHITLGVSSMSDGEAFSSLMTTASVLGNLEIDVVSTMKAD